MIRKCLFAVAALLFMVSASNASILNGLLSHDGKIDTLEDESRTRYVDRGDAGFSTGDVIWGFASISDITPDPPDYGLNQVAILYSFQVTSDLGSGLFGLTSTTAAGLSLDELLPTFSPVTNGAGSAAFIVLANTGAFDPLTDGAGGGVVASSDFGTYFNSTDWEYQLTGGFGTGSTDYLEFQTIGVGNIVGGQEGGFSVLDHTFAPNIIFSPISSTAFSGGTTFHDVTLTNATIFGGGTNGWTFTDNADFLINTVPEPSSIAIFGVLGIGSLAVAGRRRRKQNAAA